RAEGVRERIDRRPRPPVDPAETAKCCRAGRHATRRPHVDDEGRHARFSESRDIIRLGPLGSNPPLACTMTTAGMDPTAFRGRFSVAGIELGSEAPGATGKPAGE